MAEKRTALHDIHLRSAVRMVKGGGDYMFPVSYVSPIEEHKNTRTNVGMPVSYTHLTLPTKA